MKKIVALLILITCLGIVKAQQNLVPNSSFEDTITCHSYDYRYK